MDPMEVTYEEAIELIQAKRKADAEKIIKKFDEEPELEILNGRYGPYIAYKGSNYKIPKNVEPKDLNLETCMEIIKLQEEKGTVKKKKFASKKK